MLAKSIASENAAEQYTITSNALGISFCLGLLISFIILGFGQNLLLWFISGGKYLLPSSAQISKDTWYVINQATSYCKIRALTAPLSVMGSIAQCVSLVYFDIKTAIVAVIVTTSINIIGDQRGVWNEYFKKEGIDHLFFSSFNEQAVPQLDLEFLVLVSILIKICITLVSNQLS